LSAFSEYCNHNSLKPLSTADFGKVMKQVYPQVRPRRLGTRGNSRYCYAGLKKKLRLDDPFTPEVGGEQQPHVTTLEHLLLVLLLLLLLLLLMLVMMMLLLLPMLYCCCCGRLLLLNLHKNMHVGSVLNSQKKILGCWLN
jgi:hypothetical protein